jgi:hypothetical protein
MNHWRRSCVCGNQAVIYKHFNKDVDEVVKRKCKECGTRLEFHWNMFEKLYYWIKTRLSYDI